MRACRVCGCHDWRSCPGSCTWVGNEDLCSACLDQLTVPSFESILAERIRQDAKWGEQNHEPHFWMSILGEEFGELCQAVNETVFNNGPEEREKGGYENMRREAVHVAAVAVAFIEYLDRRYGADNIFCPYCGDEIDAKDLQNIEAYAKEFGSCSHWGGAGGNGL